MKEPSAKRQRTLALHDRALRFSNTVNRDLRFDHYEHATTPGEATLVVESQKFQVSS